MDSTSALRPQCNILLLKEDSSECTLIRMVLEGAEMRLCQADNIETAMRFVQPSYPDVILVDWDIDGIDGRLLLTELTSWCTALKRVPAMILTDRVVTQKTVNSLLREGYKWILRKPIVMTSLPKLISQTINDAPAPRLQGHAISGNYRLLECGQTASMAFMPAVGANG